MTHQRTIVGGALLAAGGRATVFRTAVLAGVASLLLAGCQTSQPTAETLARHDYRLKHPIVISEQAETYDIPVAAETRGLSSQLRASVHGFAREANLYGSGPVEILVPSGTRNEAAAQSVAHDIRRALSEGGVSRARIGIRSYPVGDPNVVAPIRIAYARIKAAVHACGRWTDNVVTGPSNANYEDFGCATQSNLAAMVANPADLLQPRASGPADRARRDTVFDKYRQGVSPSGKYDEGVGAKVSDVGN